MTAAITFLISSVVVAVVAVLIAAATSGTSVAKAGPVAAPETTTDTTEPTTSTTEPTTTTTRPTSSTTTTTRSTPRTTTPAGPRAVYELGQNPLFADNLGGLPPVTCSLTRWRSTPDGAAAFYRSALVCLEAAWAPVLQRANLPYSPPKLEAPADRPPASACPGGFGAAPESAFYCARNQTIFMPFAPLRDEERGAYPGRYLAVLAHEYGHHIQLLSGVDDAYSDARLKAQGGWDGPAGLALSRRLELGAQCFSGMFLAATANRGSVDANIVREARTDQDRGDDSRADLPRDHGTNPHNAGWWNQGFTKNSTQQCNTWLAPADTVT